MSLTVASTIRCRVEAPRDVYVFCARAGSFFIKQLLSTIGLESPILRWQRIVDLSLTRALTEVPLENWKPDFQLPWLLASDGFQ
jgi:hypothetical protein